MAPASKGALLNIHYYYYICKHFYNAYIFMSGMRVCWISRAGSKMFGNGERVKLVVSRKFLLQKTCFIPAQVVSVF